MRKGQHKMNLTDSEYTNMVQHLLTKCTPSGKLRMRAADTVAEMFGCIPTTVRQVWKRAFVDLSGKKTISIPSGSARSVITKYSSVVKPSLTDAVCRLNWAIDQVHDIDGEKFIDAMYDTVHVDEKWFFMTRLQRKVIGASGEKIKQRTCKSKRHLLKVMFLSAVARPRWDNSKEEWFDGRSVARNGFLLKRFLEFWLCIFE
ncbi:hypothetical protein B5M09_000167 [Aphanomyces astaci]|uniref:DUF7769 domain-containing protein n=1 Tax=Aphanomyces astaci TaxID=112090 RepID=A0A3R7WHR0_APHAT|nr:hypothetical protein B5M09_000167 [Aphanomyces astaci]